MNTFKTKNISINFSTKEEILIKSLIEEIYDTEKKISEINNKENLSQNGLYQNNQKLIELSNLKENLNQKIILLNRNFQREFDSKKKDISLQNKQINYLNITLEEYKKR